MVDITFNDWLIKEINAKGWSQSELARKAGITRAAISLILSQSRKPGSDVCSGIAEALDYPPEFVFRMAGILPPARLDDPTEEELLYLYDRLPNDRKQEIRDLIRYYIDKNEGE